MILHQPIAVTFFSGAAASTKREENITPTALTTLILTTTAAEKGALPWIKLATFGDRRTDKGSLRHDANVLSITGIEADYDAATMSYDEAHERLVKAGLAAILYTSPSHTEDTPRWRVLCPVSCPMEPARRQHMAGRLNGLFGGIFARESFTLSQSFYFGSVARNPSHRAELIDGEAIDCRDDLDRVWIGPPGACSNPADCGDGEARGDAELVRRIVTGSGYHVEMCALAGRYLARGMTPHAAADTLRGFLLSHPDAARDARWHDRYASVPSLVNSAEQKYRGDTMEGRRAVARLIGDMKRHRAPAAEIRTAAISEAARFGLPPKAANDIAEFIYRRERARIGAAHAA